MFARTFRTVRRRLSPRWLNDGEGGLVGYSLDLIKDAFLERARLGLLAGYPQNGPNGETAPTDALAEMGRDRRVVRGINETDEDYAARLRTWLTDRRTAGNPFTLMRVLAGYIGTGSSFRTFDVRGNAYSRSEAGVETSSLDTGLWDWDGITSRWSRFWVVIYPPAGLWSESTNDWGDAGLDYKDIGLAWGSTMLPSQASTIRALVNDWKPGGTRCVNIIVAFDPASFAPGAPEPNGLWGRWSKTVAGVRVASRLSTARYLGGA
jgi:hypothetical protein